MKVLVWGLGYVGTVSAAGLASLGHEVIGIEPSQAKIKAIEAGASAIKEPGLDELIKSVVASGRMRVSTDGVPLVKWADVSLVCVGTPSSPDGSTRMDFIRKVAADIAAGLKDATGYHVVVMRSTVFPGTVRNEFGPLIANLSGRTLGVDFGLSSNPEFLRETTAIDDFRTPPYTVIGEFDKRSGDVTGQLYTDVPAPLHRVAIEEAELLKLCNNSFHALKIGFANEIGRLSDEIGLDSHTVMRLVCADTKLNISPAYLRPGFAFGGSCLPKDLRNMMSNARRLGVQLPILDSVLTSNQLQVDAAHAKLSQLKARRVAVLGLSFKPHTDDLRESPLITLVHNLWREGTDVSVFDPGIKLSEMLGSNREYLERQLPQIQEILRSSLAEALDGAQAVVVGHNRPEFTAALAGLGPEVAILDLVRMGKDRRPSGLDNYRGIAW